MQLNKWPSQGTSTAPQVRSLRKVNNEQLAISIDDVDSDDRDKLDDDDDDKGISYILLKQIINLNIIQIEIKIGSEEILFFIFNIFLKRIKKLDLGGNSHLLSIYFFAYYFSFCSPSSWFQVSYYIKICPKIH